MSVFLLECRFAKYFKTENGTEFRTLHKAFAIRFDVMVTGNVSYVQLQQSMNLSLKKLHDATVMGPSTC